MRDECGYRKLAEVRLSKVAVEHADYPIPVLNHEWMVEAELTFNLRNVSGRDARVRAEPSQYGVARQDTKRTKDKDRRADDHGNAD